MSNDEQLEELQRDMRVFFENSKSDDAYNATLAQPYIRKWGEKFGWMATAWVATRIQQQRMLPDMLLVQSAMGGISIAQSLIKAYGPKGVAILLAAMKVGSDEDSLAIDALILASDDFANPKWCPFIKQAFRRVVGTSCKMSLAVALHACGDSQELKRFVDDGYFGDPQMVDFVRSGLKADNLGRSIQEIEKDLLGGFAMGGGGPMEGVFGVLALDIASQGRDFPERHPHLRWIRKQYND